MNGFTLLGLLALAVIAGFVWRIGAPRTRRPARAAPLRAAADDDRTNATEPRAEAPSTSPSAALFAQMPQLIAFAEDRRRLFGELADARAEIARYRQIVIDIERDAPPPLLDAPGTPDDLKLIVGVGPVIERMLQQMGIATYRQIARWSERDIDDIDARLREFPGRIRRDGWVKQARALHVSKYGTNP